MATDSAKKKLQGTGSVTNASKTATIIGAISGKIIRIKIVKLSVTVAATGGSGICSVRDGTTVLQSFDANTLGDHDWTLDNNNELGYDLTLGNAFTIAVSGAVTADATVFCTAIGVQLI